MSKWAKLNFNEIDMMSIGMVLDHVLTYSEMLNPNKEDKVKKATSTDIKKFKSMFGSTR